VGPVKLVTTALIKDDLVDPALGPQPGGISKTKSNLVDVIVRNAVGPHNFVVSLCETFLRRIDVCSVVMFMYSLCVPEQRKMS